MKKPEPERIKMGRSLSVQLGATEDPPFEAGGIKGGNFLNGET